MDRKSGTDEGLAEWKRLRESVTWSLFFLLLLWSIQGAEILFETRWTTFGIFPRRAMGLPGILLAPFLHANAMHLFSNSMPLFVLVAALLYHYRNVAAIVIACVYLLGGLAVWGFARPSYHIGASGLTYGLVSFIFLAGILHKERAAIALALLVTFLYGSMVWGVLPGEEHVSWEAHLFSSVVGLGLAIWQRWKHPPSAEVRETWEERYAAGINEDGDWTDYEGYSPDNLGDDPERGIYR